MDRETTYPEVRLGNPALDDGQVELPLATEGVVRYIWHSRFGAVLIEAREGSVYVNGEPVQPAAGNFSGNGQRVRPNPPPTTAPAA